MHYQIIKEQYDFIEITNENISITLSSFGASIYSLKCFGHDFFLAPDDKNIFLTSKGYYGKTLGPIAGRYELNDYYKDKHGLVLHGGDKGLSYKNFNYKIIKKTDTIIVKFSYTYDEQETFVGNHAKYEINYTISNTNKISIEHRVTALEDTYASMSVHSYFALAVKDVRKLKLRLLAKQVSDISDDYRILGLTDIPKNLDFSQSIKIANVVETTSPLLKKGHHYDKVSYPIVIDDGNCGVLIESDYPDALITLDQVPCGEVCLGEKEKPFRAIVIEPEIMPNKKDTLLIKKGNTRANIITYCFFSSK